MYHFPYDTMEGGNRQEIIVDFSEKDGAAYELPVRSGKGYADPFFKANSHASLYPEAENRVSSP